MNWEEAIDIVVGITKQNKDSYINKCSESNPDYIRNRENIIRKANNLTNNTVKLKEFPSVLQQGKNLAKSMIEFANSGFEITPDNIIKERISICESCDSFEKESRRCYECGCFVDEKVKIAVSECPLKLWLAIKKPPSTDEVKGGCVPCGAKVISVPAVVDKNP